jgi:hypothetical protein
MVNQLPKAAETKNISIKLRMKEYFNNRNVCVPDPAGNNITQ